MSNIVGVPPEALRVPLPSVPHWFEYELSRVARRDGRPVFKLVNGQTETKWRNGKMDLKHLLQTDKAACYIPVVIERYARQKGDGTYKSYPTYGAAKSDTDPGLSGNIKIGRIVEMRPVGRACWIVEVYVSPDEIDRAAWLQARFQTLKVMGVDQRVDVLGEYPNEGMYIYCFSVLDDEGNATAPNDRTLEECRRRWALIQGDTRTAQEGARMIESSMADFERKQIERISDSFYQYHGIAARRFHYGAVSKPIITSL